MSEHRELAVVLAKKAIAQGVDAAEVFIADSKSLAIDVRFGKVEAIKNAGTTGLGLRVIKDGASALASTRDLSEEALDELLRETLTLVTVTDPDPLASLPDVRELGSYVGDLGLYDSDLAAMEIEKKIELAQLAESAGLESDERINNSSGAIWHNEVNRITLANSEGFVGQYTEGWASLMVSLLAEADGVKQTDSWGTGARRLQDMETPREVGLEAAKRACRKLGARSIKSQRMTVVFDPATAADLMQILTNAASASSINRKSSFLVGKLGTKIAADCVNLVDDALLLRGMGSRPFDGEGVRSRPTQIVENGRLVHYLADTYFGKSVDIKSTGNANRSFSTGPEVGHSNLLLQPGKHTPEEILASVGEGFYVTRLYWVGINPVTGDLSRGAEGLYFKNGQFEHAVQEVTVAGNILDMLNRVVMVGNDQNFRSSIVAPTIAVENVMVSGRS